MTFLRHFILAINRHIIYNKISNKLSLHTTNKYVQCLVLSTAIYLQIKVGRLGLSLVFLIISIKICFLISCTCKLSLAKFPKTAEAGKRNWNRTCGISYFAQNSINHILCILTL